MNTFRLHLSIIASIALATVAAPAQAQQDHVTSMVGVLAYASVGNDHSQHLHGHIVPARPVPAIRNGRSMPDHSALLRFNVQFDTDGHVVNGLRPVRDELIGRSVVDKQRAWGTEPSPASCNGEWEFQRFAVDTINSDADLAACAHHHVPGPGDELSGAGHRHREIE
ncbi:MAG: hypothetical protein ACXWJW_16095 [Xanthobacteraceae bacterium]